MGSQQVIKELYVKSPNFAINDRINYFPYEKDNENLEDHGHWDYFFNNYGFRSHDESNYSLDDPTNDIWCFGCSFTMGTGVSREHAWPSVIQRLTGRNVKNFGVGGSGPLTTWRLMQSWYRESSTKPKDILVLGFWPGRTEIWKDNCYQLQTHNNMLDLPYNPFEVGKMYEDVVPKINNFHNTTLIDVEKLLKIAIDRKLNDMGRDNSIGIQNTYNYFGHPGIKCHNFIAHTFLEKLKSK